MSSLIILSARLTKSAVLFGLQMSVLNHNLFCRLLRHSKNISVLKQIRNSHFRQTVLTCAEKIHPVREVLNPVHLYKNRRLKYT